MHTSYKFHLIKVAFLVSYLIFSLLAGYAWAQPNQDCGELSFNSEILKFEVNETCYDVVLEVSNNENLQLVLSHVDFGKDFKFISFLAEFTFYPVKKLSEKENPLVPVIANKAGQSV